MPENFALEWDKTGERIYETGTDRGVVYPFNNSTHAYDNGVAWNGLTGVTESPSGADATDLWADNMKYLSMRAAEQFGGTIEAYTYPDQFAVLDGSAELATGVMIGQQKRGTFGLCYRTRVGNDTELDDYGYKLHLVYGCSVSPSERAYSTVNDSPEAITFSWEFSSVPVNVANHRPTSVLTIDTSKFKGNTTLLNKLAELEQILYGTPAVEADLEHNIEAVAAVAPRLPLPDEVAQIFTVSNANAGGQG